VVLDNLSTGFRDAVCFGPFYHGSISNTALVKQIVEKHQPIGAILFAGFIAVGESTGQPRKYLHNNVDELMALVDALMDSGVRRVVFSSTAAVYGIQGSDPIPEDASKNPVSPYADTKWFVERMLSWYGSAYGLQSVCLRYFNAAGADPTGQLGERHDPETHLVPLAIRAALGGKPLRVFGTDYPTPDGTAIRDYIHVLDLADAHLRALRYLENGGASCALNLGTGQGNSVLEVIQAVQSAGGCEVPAEFGPRREGDAPVLVADARKAKDVLGWTPQHSSIENIVQTAWRWHQKAG
jgi:UDP-glucose-4-epimerase GalE